MALDTRLISITIVYCRNDQQWQKEIDLEKAGGLFWNNTKASNHGNAYVPGKQILLDDPCPTPMVVPDTSACWWDNRKNQWVCPDGLGS